MDLDDDAAHRDAAVHKYDTVQRRLREHVLTGLEAGQALDSERRLAEQFGVSRVTIRTALDLLEGEGLVTRVHGSGTYKTDAVLVGKVHQPTSFSSVMKQRGKVATYEVLELKRGEAGDTIAGELSIGPLDPVLTLKRLLLADGEPIGIEQAFLPEDRFSGISLEDFTVSLYDILQTRYGRSMRTARRRIAAVILTAEEARLLHTEPGAASLLVSGTTSDPYGIPMEHFKTRFRADMYEYDMTVQAGR